MKNSQKGSTLVFILILLALVIISGGFYFFQLNPNKVSVNTHNETPTASTTPEDLINNGEETPVIDSISSNMTYTDNDFGFSFTYPKEWKLSKPTELSGAINIVLKQSNGDSITISKLTGVSVTDQDSKFGSVTYYYNVADGSWMGIIDSERGDDRIPVKVKPSFYTDSGLSVFPGTGRWKTDIVALSHNKFLIVNVTGSGEKSTLDPFVKSIKATQIPSEVTLAKNISNPVIYSITSASGFTNQFYAGEKVTLTGNNFPVQYMSSLQIWIGQTKVSGSGIISATPQKIEFTAPSQGALYPGAYKIFITGVVTDTYFQSMLQSGPLSVTVLPSLVIDSVTPSPAKVGQSISISGKGFASDKSGQILVHIAKTNIQTSRDSGVIWLGVPKNDTTIEFTLPAEYCSFGGGLGTPCSEKSTLTAGTYKLNVTPPNGGISNRVDFSVTN